MVTAAKGPMDIPAPRKPDLEPEILSDVLDDAGAARHQRWIAWLCGAVTAAALLAAWVLS